MAVTPRSLVVEAQDEELSPLRLMDPPANIRLACTRIVAGLAAANRDSHRFPDPNRLDLEPSDNLHVAFGWAAHFCFGAALSRHEGQIAFHKLLSRISRPRLLEESLTWRDNVGVQSLTSLRISFEADRSMEQG
jgi:pimeloyl-[acyl-carrier protein] synthase